MLISKLRDYATFIKLRLSSLVVFSAVICYFFATRETNYIVLINLIIGGFLITGASNGINQILEIKTDSLMNRTSGRPLPTGKIPLTEAIFIAVVTGISGIFLLWFFVNPLSGVLGTLALLLYTLAYTPLKKITPFSVFVGAFPGAIPSMLGCVAATTGDGKITLVAWLMFAVQFMWQFPHFWAIGWVLDEDYKRGGFNMLPSPGGRDKGSAFQCLVYSVSLIPISLLPVFFGFSGTISAFLVSICGILFALQAFRLYKTCEDKDASKLMFASFIYLPVVQLSYLIDKV